jgi:hypothetical protein
MKDAAAHSQIAGHRPFAFSELGTPIRGERISSGEVFSRPLGSGQPPLRPAGDVYDDNCRPDFPCPIGQVSVTAADGPDGAGVNAACVAC